MLYLTGKETFCMGFDHIEFIKERNKALLSLDENKILSFCRKYGVYHPHSDLDFWHSVHKSRVAIKNIPERDKEISRKWLIDHGFKDDLNT
jgi:hypothetical protein